MRSSVRVLVYVVYMFSFQLTFAVLTFSHASMQAITVLLHLKKGTCISLDRHAKVRRTAKVVGKSVLVRAFIRMHQYKTKAHKIRYTS